MKKDHTLEGSDLPETVETLIDWKLPNQAEPFSEEEFFNVPDGYIAEVNALFDEALKSE